MADVITIHVTEGVYRLLPGEIICLEASSNYTRFHLSGNRLLLTSSTLKKYEEALAENDFVRVHHSYLVNKKHILYVDDKGLIHLSNRSVIRISRRKRNSFKYLNPFFTDTLSTVCN